MASRRWVPGVISASGHEKPGLNYHQALLAASTPASFVMLNLVVWGPLVIVTVAVDATT